MRIFKDIVNSILNRRIKLHGNFDNWSEAKKSKGYNDNIIFLKQKEVLIKYLTAMQSLKGIPVAFYKDNPNFDLINIISQIKKSKIKICDFGGSFASCIFRI